MILTPKKHVGNVEYMYAIYYRKNLEKSVILLNNASKSTKQLNDLEIIPK